MGRRGRPTCIVSMMSRLQGSVVAKERARVVFGNLGGSLGVWEACHRLGMGRTLFRSLRQAALAAALRALEPRRPGRPRRAPREGDMRVRELEEKLARAQEELAAARVREEIAFYLPRAGRKMRRTAKRATSGVPRSRSSGTCESGV